MARHALLTTALEEPELNDDGAMIVARDFFGRGNPVDAIETPAPRTALSAEQRFLEPGRITPQVDYDYRPPGHRGEAVTATPRINLEATDETGVAIRLAWRMPVEPAVAQVGSAGSTAAAGDRDPIVGFRVHRIDRYDPRLHRSSPDGIAPLVELETRAVPALYFQSTPSTIELRAMTFEDEDGQTLITGDWQPGIPDPVTAGDPTTVQIWTPSEVRLTDDFPYTDDFDERTNPAFRGRVFLLESIRDVLEHLVLRVGELLDTIGVDARINPRGLAQEVEPDYVLNVAFPLEDRSDPQSTRDITQTPPTEHARRFAAAFTAFIARHDAQTDPYAWQLSKAVGMSCEAILIDRLTGDPLPLDTLIREYGLLRYLHENWGDGPTPPLDLALFIAEDGVTYLNVLRLIHAADWPRWEEEPRQMALALLLQCLGHYPYQLEQGGVVARARETGSSALSGGRAAGHCESLDRDGSAAPAAPRVGQPRDDRRDGAGGRLPQRAVASEGGRQRRRYGATGERLAAYSSDRPRRAGAR